MDRKATGKHKAGGSSLGHELSWNDQCKYTRTQDVAFSEVPIVEKVADVRNAAQARAHQVLDDSERLLDRHALQLLLTCLDLHRHRRRE